jgi:hypothetical protein
MDGLGIIRILAPVIVAVYTPISCRPCPETRVTYNKKMHKIPLIQTFSHTCYHPLLRCKRMIRNCDSYLINAVI